MRMSVSMNPNKPRISLYREKKLENTVREPNKLVSENRMLDSVRVSKLRRDVPGNQVSP
jgi:hypothetical protein